MSLEKIREKTFCRYCGNSIQGRENIDYIRIPSLSFGTERFVCMHCAETVNNISSYSTEKNDVKTFGSNMEESKKTSKNFQWAVEFEGDLFLQSPVVHNIPLDSKIKIAAFLASEYHLYPSHDSTVAIECKSDRRYNFHGIKNELEGISKIMDMTSNWSGQHINISKLSWDKETGNLILDYAKLIFTPLAMYLSSHLSECEQVFGRKFKSYCEFSTTHFHHGDWLNIRVNSSRDESCLEFRLAKFQNVNQYFFLLNFCRDCMELVDQLISDSPNDYKAAKIGNKIVKLFVKYASGNATCMSDIRNKKTRILKKDEEWIF